MIALTCGVWLIGDLKTSPEMKNYHRTFVASTPLGDDYMREGVKLCRKRKRKSYIAVALLDDQNLIGWAMLDIFLSKHSKNVRTYIYVKTKYRRKGYGTRILQKAKEVAKKRYKYIDFVSFQIKASKTRICRHSNVDANRDIERFLI